MSSNNLRKQVFFSSKFIWKFSIRVVQQYSDHKWWSKYGWTSCSLALTSSASIVSISWGSIFLRRNLQYLKNLKYLQNFTIFCIKNSIKIHKIFYAWIHAWKVHAYKSCRDVSTRTSFPWLILNWLFKYVPLHSLQLAAFCRGLIISSWQP